MFFGMVSVRARMPGPALLPDALWVSGLDYHVAVLDPLGKGLQAAGVGPGERGFLGLLAGEHVLSDQVCGCLVDFGDGFPLPVVRTPGVRRV